MRRLLAASVVLCALLLPTTALGHAELVSADPGEGATIEGPAFPITLTFSEELGAGSNAEVVDAAAAVVLTIEPDAADLTRMAYAPSAAGPQFSAGEYTIRWTSVGDDGDILRGTITFTVTEPPPSPSPSLEPSATAAPSASPSPSPSPTPAATAEPAGGSGDSGAVLIPIVAALAIVIGGAVWLMRRRPTS